MKLLVRRGPSLYCKCLMFSVRGSQDDKLRSRSLGCVCDFAFRISASDFQSSAITATCHWPRTTPQASPAREFRRQPWDDALCCR